VSIATQRIPIVPLLEAQARRELAGVGDPRLGEWTEWTGRAFHLRRRLSAREQRTVGPVEDIRGSLEAARRYDRLPAQYRALIPPDVADEELHNPACPR
jgi:hypothetical protein